MAKLEVYPDITIEVTIRLTEPEVRALSELVGYGDKSILNVLGAHLGSRLQGVHSDGFTSVFKTLRGELPKILRRTDLARRTFLSDGVDEQRVSVPTMDPGDPVAATIEDEVVMHKAVPPPEHLLAGHAYAPLPWEQAPAEAEQVPIPAKRPFKEGE